MSEVPQRQSKVEQEIESAKREYESQLSNAASFLIYTALELPRWSQYLDWSERLKGEGVTKNRQILKAFRDVKRIDFLPPESRPRNGEDHPLPIGYEQTNSQPSTVASMLQWLRLKKGQKVLDVGSGSGWTSALLGTIVGPEGEVHATEIIPELAKTAATNVAQYDLPQVKVHHTPKRIGLRDRAPFDRILVSANVKKQWVGVLQEQLSPDGGIMVLPIAKNDSEYNSDKAALTAVIRRGENFEVLKEYPDFRFVPLINVKELEE